MRPASLDRLPWAEQHAFWHVFLDECCIMATLDNPAEVSQLSEHEMQDRLSKHPRAELLKTKYSKVLKHVWSSEWRHLKDRLELQKYYRDS